MGKETANVVAKKVGGVVPGSATLIARQIINCKLYPVVLRFDVASILANRLPKVPVLGALKYMEAGEPPSAVGSLPKAVEPNPNVLVSGELTGKVLKRPKKLNGITAG